MTIFTDDGGTFDNSLEHQMDLSTKYAQDNKRQDTQKTVSDVLESYHVSPAFKQGIGYNINAESGWDPYNRHVDQPRFGGEAHYSHGLLQEGGSDVRPLFDYAISKGKQWTDPEVQMRYAFEQNPKGKAFLEKYGQSQDWREVAAGFAKDYLNPKKEYLESRIADIYGRPHIDVTKPYPKFNEATIDRTTDVPLLAGGLQSKDGTTYGTAIDRNIPHYHTIDGLTFDTGEFVHHHEMEEIKDMEGKTLASEPTSAAAYLKSHNEIATPAEEQQVKAFAESKGKDPEKFWASYQQFWKDQLSNIKDKVPEKVHPDLYLHPYDGHPMQQAVESLAGRTIAQMSIRPIENTSPGAQGWLTENIPSAQNYDNQNIRRAVTSVPEEEDPQARKMEELSKGMTKSKDPWAGLLEELDVEQANTQLNKISFTPYEINQYEQDLISLGISRYKRIQK